MSSTKPTPDFGTSVAGQITAVGSDDIYPIILTAGYAYQFDVLGLGWISGTGPYPTLPNPTLVLYKSNGSTTGSSTLVSIGDRREIYTPNTTDTYYIHVDGTGTGAYTLTLAPQDDYSDLFSTTAAVAFGGSIMGVLQTTADLDLFQVSLVAGTSYEFDVFGDGSGVGTVVNPTLTVYKTNQTQAGATYSTPASGDRRAVYTPSTTGVYYLEVGGGTPTTYSPGSTYTYRLSVPIAVKGNITDTSGNQIYVGGTTQDSLTFAEGRRGVATALTSGNTEITIEHLNQIDTARGLEELRFIDGRITFDPADPAAQVTRMYKAAVGRAPDQGGLNEWTAFIKAGSPLVALANRFIASSEFNTRYGDVALTSNYVTAIYRNALGREPDSGGLAFYVNAIDSGVLSRADVLTQFSESLENKGATALTVSAGIWDRNENSQKVARLYDTALGRLADAGGLSYWTNTMDAGNAQPIDLARTFTNSAEFIKTYGLLDNNQSFVEAIYINTFHHPGDVAGIKYWTDQLNAGVSRAQVTLGFSESPEHVANMIPITGGETLDTFGIKLA